MEKVKASESIFIYNNNKVPTSSSITWHYNKEALIEIGEWTHIVIEIGEWTHIVIDEQLDF